MIPFRGGVLESSSAGHDPRQVGRSASPNRSIMLLSSIVLVFGLAISIYGAVLLMTGSPEAYHNENLRHLAGGLTLALLAACLITQQLNRSRTSRVLLVTCFGVIAWSLSLSFLGR